MSINAVSSLPVYEYYYSINGKNKNEKYVSPLAEEMKKYGLVPTEDETMNAALLQKAKNAQSEKTQKTLPDTQRPWADLMYQLNLEFSPDPKEDIKNIKAELAKLLSGISDDELEKEVNDLETYVDKLYQGSFGSGSTSIDAELNNLSTMNRAFLS